MAIREIAARTPVTLNLRSFARDAHTLAEHLESQLQEPLRTLGLVADWVENRQLAITSSYEIVDETVILANAAGAALTVTLPASNEEMINRDVFIKKTDSDITHAVTVQARGSDLIEGASSLAITPEGQCFHFLADGLGNWRLISTIAATSGGGGGGVPSPATAAPIIVNFTAAAVGVSLKYAREDHRHKLDSTINATGADVWTGAHKWSPTANAVPITVHKTASLTSADTFAVTDTDDSYLVVVDNIGLTGINCDPDSMLTIQDIPAAPVGAPVAWYKADTIGVGNGNNVTTWTDSSSSGNNLTADGKHGVGTSSATRPKWYAAGQTKATTNLPAVSLEGTVAGDTDFGYFAMASPIDVTLAAGWTLGMIWRDHTANSQTNTVLGNDTAAGDTTLGHITISGTSAGPGTNIFSYNGKFAANSNWAHTDGNDTEAIVLRCTASTGQLEVWIDGVLQTVTPGTGSQQTASTIRFRDLGAVNIGGSWGCTLGKSIAEFIIYNTGLSNGDVTTLNTYLLNRIAGTAVATGGYDFIRMKDGGTAAVLSRFDENAYLGIGVDPSYPVDVIKALATQQRIGYDTSNYYTTAVGATGVVTFDATGAGQSFVFVDPVTFQGAVTFPSGEFAAPVSVDLAANSAGVATTISRSDHHHQLDQSITPTWTGVHTFTPQDIHTAGISLSTSGVVLSNVATAGIVFDLQDNLGAGARTSGTLLRIRRAADSREIMDVSWDGRFGFGYSSQTIINQAGHVLGFIQDDADSPAGAPHLTGIASLMRHSSATQTVAYGYGIVGAWAMADATTINSKINAGVRGNFASSIDASFSGKMAAGVAAGFGTSNSLGAQVSGTNEPQNYDQLLAMGSNHFRGSYDHLTNFWADLYGEAASLTLPTNKPARVSAFRAPIQTYPSSHTAGSPVGETWAIYGEAPSTGVSTTGTAGTAIIAHYPAVTGFMRVPYPRFTGGTGVRAMQQFWEPWPNTSTIRGGAAIGDVYFDDGTNFVKGLHESVVAGAYQPLLYPTIKATGAAGAGNAGSISGQWTLTKVQAITFEQNTGSNRILNIEASAANSVGTDLLVQAGSTTGSANGGNLNIFGGDCATGTGGNITVMGGTPSVSGKGGSVTNTGAQSDTFAQGANFACLGGGDKFGGAASNDYGGDAMILGGNASGAADGGDIYIGGGAGSGGGAKGKIKFYDQGGAVSNTWVLSASNHTYTLPDYDGTVTLDRASTYTPTLTNVTNITSSSAGVFKYMRMGNIVQVTGSVNITPTSAAACTLRMSLPYSANFVGGAEAYGLAQEYVSGQIGGIGANVTFDTADINFTATTTSVRTWHLTFMYEVV